MKGAAAKYYRRVGIVPETFLQQPRLTRFG